jgi:hypothetical protein
LRGAKRRRIFVAIFPPCLPFPAPLHLSENPYTTQEQEARMFTLLSLASLAVGVISLAFQLYDRRRK